MIRTRKRHSKWSDLLWVIQVEAGTCWETDGKLDELNKLRPIAVQQFWSTQQNPKQNFRLIIDNAFDAACGHTKLSGHILQRIVLDPEHIESKAPPETSTWAWNSRKLSGSCNIFHNRFIKATQNNLGYLRKRIWVSQNYESEMKPTISKHFQNMWNCRWTYNWLHALFQKTIPKWNHSRIEWSKHGTAVVVPSQGYWLFSC